MQQKPLCFVISPIGAEGSDIRKRADQVLCHIIAPAVEACGYDYKRGDQIAAAGVITAQVTHLLMNCPLVIADLSGHNPNVFYELSIRHSVSKPCIQMIDAQDKVPFDVADQRTILYDLT